MNDTAPWSPHYGDPAYPGAGIISTPRNRDARGRFQRPPVDIARAMETGCLFYDAKGTTHSRNHCGDISGRARRCHSTPRGWLCSTCIAVAVDGWDGDEPVSKSGSATCGGCDRTLPVTKFPTTLINGVGQVRDGRVCRSCRKDGVRVSGELGFAHDDLPTRGPDGTWYDYRGLTCAAPSWWNQGTVRGIIELTYDQALEAVS